MPESSTALLIGVLGVVVAQLATFATLVFNARQQRLREERVRGWEVQDRAMLARTVTETSERLAATVTNQHGSVVAAIADNTHKTEEATQKATEAFQEANHVNNKIAHLNAAIIDNSTKIEQAIAGAHEAYREANHVNSKISELQQRLLTQERLENHKKNPESRKA
jgi:methyl-accepting chemotaxis protein